MTSTDEAQANPPLRKALASGQGQHRTISDLLYRYGLLVVLALMIAAFSITQPFFATFSNVMFVLQASSIVVVAGLGCTMSMTVGGFDLAVGASLGLSVMAAAAAMVIYNVDGVVAVLIGLAAGLLVGLFNTVLIVYARIPDLVATLATLFLVNGATLLAVGGQSIAPGMSVGDQTAPGTFSPVFQWIGSGSLVGVPASVVISALVFVAVMVLLDLTRWGRVFYAVGGNPIAAAAVGINVNRYRGVAYCISGLLAAVGGVLLAARAGRGDVAVGNGYLLQAVSAALVGYAVLGANRPNALGTLVGAIFVAVLINGLTMFNFPYYAQDFVQGLLLVVALLLSYTLGPLRKR